MTKRIFILSLFSILICFIISCTIESISATDSKNSHHTGENCMKCHYSGGDGKGIFTVAGTVYNSQKTDPVQNPTIYLFSQPNGGGNLILELNGDLNGNFYTTQNINFLNGLYPAVSRIGSLKYMTGTVTSGACSSCHSVSTDRVWTF